MAPSNASGDPSSKEAFQDLGLHTLKLMDDKVRVRQHVNPLKRELQMKQGPLAWGDVFANPSLPLVVDVGCGCGRFPIKLGTQRPGNNILGLEIRGPLVERANAWVWSEHLEHLRLRGRVHFAKVNATISMASMLATYPGGVELVCVQYPDPHFKKKHKKRHTVQPQFCRDVAGVLQPGGCLYMVSDVLQVAEHMRDTFEATTPAEFEPHALFHQPGKVFHASTRSYGTGNQHDIAIDSFASYAESGAEAGETVQSWAYQGWLLENPLGCPTEREVHVHEKGGKGHRIVLRRR